MRRNAGAAEKREAFAQNRGAFAPNTAGIGTYPRCFLWSLRCENANLDEMHAPPRDLQPCSAQKSSRRDFGRQTPRCIASTVDCCDLDKQVGINVDGLKVRLGNTEKMKLTDLLKPAGHVK